jgi:hypothetical protein
MTPDERQMLAGLFDRVRGASNGPKDTEAEAFIGDALRSTPSAGYVLSQTVLVQQQALEAAAKRITDLEAQAKGGAAGGHEEGSFLGNLGRSIFGGGAQQPAPSTPRPQYDSRAYERDPGPPQGYAPQQRPGYAPPPPQPGPWGGAPSAPPPQGGGFLQGALQTATGVAGGVLLGNAIGGLFGGHSGGGGLFGGGSAGGFGQGETINETNNYYGSGTDPAGQHAEDVLQDQDQDQDAEQDAYDDGGGSDFGGGDDNT